MVKNGSNRCFEGLGSQARTGIGHAGEDRAWDESRRVVSRRVPPVGIAWMALAVRLRKTCSRAGGAIATGGKSRIEVDLDADSLDSARRRGQPGGLGQDGSSGRRGPDPGRRRARSGAGARRSFQAIDLVDEPAERLVVEPDDPALPELGGRADAGQRVADLVRDARQQLAQGREPLGLRQLGLEPVPLAAWRRTVLARPRVSTNARAIPPRARPAASR